MNVPASTGFTAFMTSVSLDVLLLAVPGVV